MKVSRANEELPDIGSAQWYWLHLLESLSTNKLKVMKWQWDAYSRLEIPATQFVDYHGVVLPYDHRIIGNNEIVIDIDMKKPWNCWGRLYDANFKFSERMKDNGIPHYVCQSGGNGFHIHVFVNGYKMIAAETILKKCRMKKYCGYGKPIDKGLLTGNHMVRIIGGKKRISESDIRYKSFIDSIEYSLEHVTDPKRVRFPDKIDVWDAIGGIS